MQRKTWLLSPLLQHVWWAYKILHVHLVFLFLFIYCRLNTCSFSFYNSFLGYSSFHSSICCKPSSQSPSLEAFLDSAFFSNDLCHAHKPQGSHWHGTTEACHMVCQSLQKEETSFSWRLVWKGKILLSWLNIICLPKDSSTR